MKKRIIIYIICILLVVIAHLFLFPLAHETLDCCWNGCKEKPLINMLYLNIISIGLILLFIILIIKDIIKK